MAAKNFRLYKDLSGEWRWRLISANSKIIADSGQGYTNKADAVHGAKLVAAEATDAGIWDSTTSQWV